MMEAQGKVVDGGAEDAAGTTGITGESEEATEGTDATGTDVCPPEITGGALETTPHTHQGSGRT